MNSFGNLLGTGSRRAKFFNLSILHQDIINMPLISDTLEWKSLEKHAEYVRASTHLRVLLQDDKRSSALVASHDGIFMDFSRQNITVETLVRP